MSRRTLAAGFAAAALAGAVLSARQRAPATGDVSRDFRYLMGNSVEVRACNGDASSRAAAIAEAFAAIAEVDRVMSNWKPDSELMSANRAAAGAPVRVSDPLFAVIKASLDLAVRSGGAFDPTIGPAVDLWGFRSHAPHVPSPGELASLRRLVDYRAVVLDERTHTMHFGRQGMEVDLGGIAKGFAVELAAGALRRRGLAGYIDAGGNQYLLGAPPGKGSWTIAVRDPDHPGAVLGVLELPEGSVSTSAETANFLTVDGRRYGHILDPRTLRPAESGALSVTVHSRDATIADAASTAALVLGPRQGLALIDSLPGMAGLITCRRPDGGIDVVMSDSLRPAYHPAARQP